MTYHARLAADIVFDRDVDLASVWTFLEGHGSALATASHTLGGGTASVRVFLLIEAVRETRRLTRAHRRQIIDLHRNLTLDHVGDLDRIETALFSEIDPRSPIVEEICLLSEALEALLYRICADPNAVFTQIDKVFPDSDDAA